MLITADLGTAWLSQQSLASPGVSPELFLEYDELSVADTMAGDHASQRTHPTLQPVHLMQAVTQWFLRKHFLRIGPFGLVTHATKRVYQKEPPDVTPYCFVVNITLFLEPCSSFKREKILQNTQKLSYSTFYNVICTI